MSKLPASVSTLLIIALGTLLAVAIILGRPQIELQGIEPKRPPLVEVIIAEPENQLISVQSQAGVTTKQRIQLNARVSGIISEVGRQLIVGAEVKRGDVLAKMVDIEYRNALAQAELSLAQAKLQVANELALAREAEGRWKDLGNKQANDFFLRKPQLESASAQLKAAEIGVELAQVNLDLTQIQAPFNGRIAAVNANLGQFVQQGSSIAELYNTQQLQLLVPLDKQQLKVLGMENYQVNPAIEVLLRDRDSASSWKGKVTAINGDIDINTRLYQVVVEVDNQQQPLLLPGLFVNVELTLPAVQNVVTLPIKSLVEGNFIFIVENNKLVKTAIQLLSKDGKQVQISGVEKNQQLVVSRPLWTVDGNEVNAKIIEL